MTSVGSAETFIRKTLTRRKGAEGRCRRLWLAVRAVTEAPAGELSPALSEELRKAALALLGNARLRFPEKERAELGSALGLLGDPRLGMERADRWVDVNLGEHKPKYWLGRYPVTNCEYRAFVEDGGYENERWWNQQAWTEREKRIGNKEPAAWENDQFNGSNQPVVGVSWYEAEAYCRWLTEQFRTKRPEWLAEDVTIRLPSGEEWERAASGGKRKYPWGNQKPDERRANFGSRLGTTSAVGIYPAGATPEGLLDMAGNVWEWSLDRDQDGNLFRRGGSWGSSAQYLVASVRWSWVRPWGRSRILGFRCCAVAVEHVS
jgi:hypothetical protein